VVFDGFCCFPKRRILQFSHDAYSGRSAGSCGRCRSQDLSKRRPCRGENATIEHRGCEALGGANPGSLDGKRQSAFAEDQDPRRERWGALRVWNDDTIQTGGEFPPHSHANMEIIPCVREGVITHRDSLGNQGCTKSGDVQVMSAGSGIRHSECNLELGITRILHIWILPNRQDDPPCWGAERFPQTDRSGRFVALARGTAGGGAGLPIRAGARVLASTLETGKSTECDFSEQIPHRYLVSASERVHVQRMVLNTRDDAPITGETRVRGTAAADSELVLVDVAT
jgi:redox-sensitive bicupin YhaK (pirin superfamily)